MTPRQGVPIRCQEIVVLPDRNKTPSGSPSTPPCAGSSQERCRLRSFPILSRQVASPVLRFRLRSRAPEAIFPGHRPPGERKVHLPPPLFLRSSLPPRAQPFLRMRGPEPVNFTRTTFCCDASFAVRTYSQSPCNTAPRTRSASVAMRRHAVTCPSFSWSTEQRTRSGARCHPGAVSCYDEATAPADVCSGEHVRRDAEARCDVRSEDCKIGRWIAPKPMYVHLAPCHRRGFINEVGWETRVNERGRIKPAWLSIASAADPVVQVMALLDIQHTQCAEFRSTHRNAIDQMLPIRGDGPVVDVSAVIVAVKLRGID